MEVLSMVARIVLISVVLATVAVACGDGKTPTDPVDAGSCGTSDAQTETRTRYESASVRYGSSCGSETQTRVCNSGAWSDWNGSYTHVSCSVDSPVGCDGTPHEGTELRVRYESASVPYSSSCVPETQTRTCDNGAWSSWSGLFSAEECIQTEPPETISETISNTPNAEFSVRDPRLEKLTIVSSHLMSYEYPATVYQLYYAHVLYEGPIVCSPLVDVTFRDASGELGTYTMLVDGRNQYDIGLAGIPFSCLVTGEEYILHGIDTVDAPINPEAVAGIEFEISNGSEPAQASVHSAQPLLDSVRVDTDPGSTSREVIRGTLTAQETIYNIAFRAYCRNDAGLFFHRVSDVHLDTLWAGSTWELSATSYENGSIADHFESVDFLPGAKPTYRALGVDVGVENEASSVARHAARERRRVSELEAEMKAQGSP
jgi:hypothetical protein